MGCTEEKKCSELNCYKIDDGVEKDCTLYSVHFVGYSHEVDY